MDRHGAPEQAGLDLFHSLSARAVADDDERGLAGDRPGKIVQQPQAGLVGLVHVVDGEQQAGPGGREAQQFRGGDEQPLVGPLPRPRSAHARPGLGRSPRGMSRRARRAESDVAGTRSANASRTGA